MTRNVDLSCVDDTKDSFDKLTEREKIEFSRRAGFAHGWVIRSLHQNEEEIQEITKEIEKWKRDLTDERGAPGSPLQNCKTWTKQPT